jgi:hypothetical protein
MRSVYDHRFTVEAEMLGSRIPSRDHWGGWLTGSEDSAASALTPETPPLRTRIPSRHPRETWLCFPAGDHWCSAADSC